MMWNLKNVTFAYKDRDVLKNVSFKSRAGEKKRLLLVNRAVENLLQQDLPFIIGTFRMEA